MKKISIVALSLLPVLIPSLLSQQILNGSFEMNGLDCGINLQNDDFNSQVMNVFAFGGQSEIDLLSVACGFESPPDGAFFVALYYNTFSDAFTFELTSPLLPGKLYRLGFAARVGDDISNQNSKIEIGLSDSRDSFGTSVYFSPVLGTDWEYYNFQVSPATLSRFISVRAGSPYETWVFTDDFSLECPEINLGNDTTLCVVENFSLEAGPFFESYQWNNLSTGLNIQVNEPGEYWVEATDGDCVIRDSITISEVPFNCGCKIYVPNVFSPNNDGINDEFRPLSPCELLDYELTVFDRWGQMAFHSVNAGESWDGSGKGRPMERGTYVYILQYRFFYQDEANISYGDLTIIR